MTELVFAEDGVLAQYAGDAIEATAKRLPYVSGF